MKLIFIGSGAAFTKAHENYNSNVILQSKNNKNLLIDCGSDARHALSELGYDHNHIDSVYISHLHADHAGGLEWFGYSRKFQENSILPKMFIHTSLQEPLWQNSLSGGMASLEGEKASLASYFEVAAVNNDFIWEDIKFDLVKMKHVINFNDEQPCYGLFFQISGTKIFFTADTQFNPDALNFYYEKADIIFHDCETSKVKSGVHSHYDSLKTLASSIKEKMWLYHYNSSDLPDAKGDGFLGFVKKQQIFSF